MGIALAILTNRYVMALIVSASLLLGSYFYGKSVARGECHDAELRAVIASMQRDVTAAAQAQEVERAQTAALDAQRQQLESQVKDYEVRLKARPRPNCVLGPDDLDPFSGVPVKRGK